MKAFTFLTGFIALVAAAPVAEPAIDINEIVRIEKRQTVGTTANDFKNGGCRDIIWFFARGSTEVGNMVSALPTLQTASTCPLNHQD